MSITDIHPIQLITPIGSPIEQKRRDPGGPSEELLEISERLKEGVEGLSAWMQLYPILHRIETDSLLAAAKELSFLSALFQNAHDELVSYCQQIPEPSDAPIALDLLKFLEKCFLEDIAEETSLELSGFGFTSWGALILSQRKIEWSTGLIVQMFQKIRSGSWRKVRQILTDVSKRLP